MKRKMSSATKECEICEITVSEHDFGSHLLGKKHLRKVESKNFKNNIIEKSIFVPHLPPGWGPLDIVKFFSQFGAIQRHKIDTSYAIIEFKQKETADLLLSKPIWMGNFKLDIRKRRWIQNSTPEKNKSSDAEISPAEIVFADLKTKLESQTNFEGALTVFLNTIRPDQSQIEHKWRILQSTLVDTLRPLFPNCTISIFGSTVTGLAFPGSDLDLFLDIGEPILDDDTTMRGWTPKTIFKEVKCLMYRNRYVYDSIVPIPKARTPIIKFRHVQTETNCDISFKNGLGVINSHLIKTLLGLDRRSKNLMKIIKYWGKTFDLSGSGKITNYALVMLTIFYLQQTNPTLVPPIINLRMNSEPVYRWNWQVNFNQNAVFPESNDKRTLAELLLGFFKFYNNFNFETHLICPLEGCAHLKTDFLKYCEAMGAPPDYLSMDRPICLQDPVELDNNITFGVTAKLLETFLRFCATGIEVCEQAIRDDKPLLLNLFTTLPIVPGYRDSYESFVVSARKTLLAGLPADFNTRTDIEDKEKFTIDNWYKLAQRLVEEVLRRVFKLDVQTTKIDREAKQQKIAATSDVHSNDNNNNVLECTGDYNVICHRKSIASSNDPTLSRIEKEALISDELIKQHNDNSVKPLKIEFSCSISTANDPVRLIIDLTNRGTDKKIFRQLGSFMATKLPSIVEKEMAHMLHYNKR